MDFLELSKKRFATRKFSQETISKEDLNYIMESVRMAPSAVNRQPWKFVIVQSGTAKEKLLQCYDREWFRSAPLYHLSERHYVQLDTPFRQQDSWRH